SRTRAAGALAGYAARTVPKKLWTSCFKRSDCLASSPADLSTNSAAVPTWPDACVTSVMFFMTPCVPCAACCTLPAICFVDAPCLRLLSSRHLAPPPGWHLLLRFHRSRRWWCRSRELPLPSSPWSHGLLESARRSPPWPSRFALRALLLPQPQRQNLCLPRQP